MPETHDEIKTLKGQIEQLQQAIERHANDPYLVAQQAFASLHFFRTHYATSAAYQEHLQDVIHILRDRGKGELNLSAGKLFSGLADLLERSS